MDNDCGRYHAATLDMNMPVSPTFTLSDFDFELPAELIAQTPPLNRGDSRLLCVERNKAPRDAFFAQVLEQLRPGDALVMNNTKVIPARLFATKATGGKVEMLVERLLDAHHFLAQIKASHKPKVGQTVMLGDGDSQALLLVTEYRAPFVVIETQNTALQVLQQFGEIPLPPYIERNPGDSDLERYQTVYAKHDGAVAAPTAGLHFTEEVLAEVQAKGVTLVYVTLHVGAGTFKPVRTENLDEHVMHHEWFELSADAAATINKTISQGGRIVAVGTTSLRALESAAHNNGTVAAMSGDTDIFITPGYQFQIVNALITNFHLPKSTLMMLVSALAGYDVIKDAYTHAIAHQYRFFSYGDAMWLDRAGA